jgi:fibronectin-binding autotransporter adhesin
LNPPISQSIRLPAAILCAALIAAPLASADDTYVGKDTDSESLSITNGDSLSSDNAYVGYWNYVDGDIALQGGRYVYDNHAYVTGTGLDDASTNWTISGDLYVGDVANYNSVEISNGGSVSSGTAYIGRGIFLSKSQTEDFPVDHNSVTLTGLGATDTTTTWTNTGMLYVGYEWARYNSLTVKSGADVTSKGGTIGLGYYYDPGDQGANIVTAYSDNNTATVTGAGSTWNCGTGNLAVGTYGSNNSLTISAGGHVTSVNGYISTTGDSTGNTVMVTGSGSLWSNSGALVVGAGGTGTLTIEDGGLVMAQSLSIGSGSKIYINNGVLALEGDKVSEIAALLSGGKTIYVNNAGSWLALSSGNCSSYVTYYSDIAAQAAILAATYGLSGAYTVVVPESATLALFCGIGALTAVMISRRRYNCHTLFRI